MPTIDKALGLLDYFSASTPEIGLAKFRELSTFDKGTVYRYLCSLRDCGYVEQNPQTKAYRLGPAIIRLAAVRETTVPLQSIAAPLIDELADQTGELVHAALAQRNGMSALYVKDGGYGGTRVGFDDSELLPLHATSSGIAFLAFGPDQYLASVIEHETLPSFTESTPVTPEKITSLVTRSKKAGYACLNQSYEAEICSVAVPLFNTVGIAMGTLAIATPRARMKRKLFVKQLALTSQHFTQNLGGKVPDTIAAKWNAYQQH